MGNKPLIAILDDDAISRLMLANAIESGGMDPVCFNNHRDFLDYTAANKLDCILLDMNMPGLNGAEVECRLNEIGSTVPVIVVTGDSDIPTATAALANGAIEVLTKPVDPLDLLTHVRAALSQESLSKSEAISL